MINCNFLYVKKSINKTLFFHLQLQMSLMIYFVNVSACYILKILHESEQYLNRVLNNIF